MSPLHFWIRLTFFQRFWVASLLTLVGGLLGVGQWVGSQIAAGVVREVASTTALFVDSFVAPELQELSRHPTLSPARQSTLSRLLQNTPLGKQIVAFKVWNAEGRLLFYSTDPSMIGQVFPVDEDLSQALSGNVAAGISNLNAPENVAERRFWTELLAVYSPVRLKGSNEIIAVAEFYQKVDPLKQEIADSQRKSWWVMGTALLTMEGILAIFVRRASKTIDRQQEELQQQVERLTHLLAQNEDLRRRVQNAAASVATHNEHLLRRISADLHDGPLQDLGFALLRLDRILEATENGHDQDTVPLPSHRSLSTIQKSLVHALEELRAISTGLGLPQLSERSLEDCLGYAIRSHERRTGVKVSRQWESLPDSCPLPVKITLYRLVQEALNNSHHHAGSPTVAVEATWIPPTLTVVVSDAGSGFDIKKALHQDDQHLGLTGMRERVESLGGQFCIDTQPQKGTRIQASLTISSP